jgi:hypothetical protein
LHPSNNYIEVPSYSWISNNNNNTPKNRGAKVPSSSIIWEKHTGQNFIMHSTPPLTTQDFLGWFTKCCAICYVGVAAAKGMWVRVVLYCTVIKHVLRHQAVKPHLLQLSGRPTTGTDSKDGKTQQVTSKSRPSVLAHPPEPETTYFK